MRWLIQYETSAATKGSVAAPSYQSVSLFIKCLGNIAFGSAVSPALRSGAQLCAAIKKEIAAISPIVLTVLKSIPFSLTGTSARADVSSSSLENSNQCCSGDDHLAGPSGRELRSCRAEKASDFRAAF